MSLETYLTDFTTRDWAEPTGADPVRFAVVGAGWWARSEAIPAMEAGEFCEPTVAADVSAENVDAAVEAFGLTGLSADEFVDGAATDEYDAVYVATPNATHPEYVGAAAAHGKPVLCEKPMAATVAGAEAMVEACEDAGVPLMIAYRMQTDPVVRRAKELIQAGAVGEVVHVHGQMSDPLFEFIDDEDQWRLDPDLSGGTSINDIGVYPLNTTRFVLESDPAAAYASHRWADDRFEGLDEHAAFQVEFPGPTAVCTVSHNAVQASHLRFVGTGGELRIEPLFFPWDDRRLHLRRGGAEAEVGFEQVNQMEEEVDYFANCLQRDVEPYPDGRHGLVDVRTIEALYESADRGERVAVDA